VRVGSLRYVSQDPSLEVTDFGLEVRRRRCKQDVDLVISIKKLTEKVSLQSARDLRLAAINTEECEHVKSSHRQTLHILALLNVYGS